MTIAPKTESYVTLAVFAIVSGGFWLGCYLPGHRRAQQLRNDIRLVEQEIANIPLKAAELEALQHDIEERDRFVAKKRRAYRSARDAHTVLHEVAELARQSQLQVTRLEPLPPEEHALHTRIPFRLTVAGPFRHIAEFLRGLEANERLCVFQRFSLKQPPGQSGGNVLGDLFFSVYADRDLLPAPVENADSSAGRVADNFPR